MPKIIRITPDITSNVEIELMLIFLHLREKLLRAQ
jgi:hypothetical protein